MSVSFIFDKLQLLLLLLVRFSSSTHTLLDLERIPPRCTYNDNLRLMVRRGTACRLPEPRSIYSHFSSFVTSYIFVQFVLFFVLSHELRFGRSGHRVGHGRGGPFRGQGRPGLLASEHGSKGGLLAPTEGASDPGKRFGFTCVEMLTSKRSRRGEGRGVGGHNEKLF